MGVITDILVGVTFPRLLYHYTLTSTSIEIGDNTNGGYKYLTFNTQTLDGLWKHIVYTKNGINHVIYINGVLDQQFTSNADIRWNQPFYIGKRWINASGSSWFNGIIDDVHIYNSDISAREVWLIYRAWLSEIKKAICPNPANRKTDVAPNVILTWMPGMNVLTHDLYFGISYNDINVAIHGSSEYKGNQTSTNWDTNNYAPAGLDFNATYYWRIDEVDTNYPIRGDVWSFTVAPLAKAGNPQPSNSQQNVSPYTILSWSAATYASSHDVYFGTSYNDVNIAAHGSSEYKGNQASTNWDTNNYAPAGLNFDTTYYWRIDEVAVTSTTKGDVWNFTVASLGKAGSPQPYNSQQSITNHAVISWSAAMYASSHDVYFGIDFNEVNNADTTSSIVYKGNQDANYWDTNNFNPNGLSYYTIYYWRVDEKLNQSTTKGDIWSFTTSVEPDITSGFAAWWKFDEGTGFVAYDSAGDNDGNLVGGPTWTSGKIGGGLTFDGANDYVDCGSGPSNYDNITVSAWMKTSTQGTLVSNRYYFASYGAWYTLSSTTIEIGDNSQGGYRNVTFNTPTLNSLWHHIVYTKNGTNHAIYVDGSLDQSFTSNADISQNMPLFIGNRWTRSGSNFWFNGIIDEVRIYNRALSADEVAMLYAE